jgi:CBS domain containing-hemolysin-like protein
VETLGGYILTQLAEVPVPGDIVTAAGYHFRILEVRDRRIRRLRGEPIPTAPVDPDADRDEN